MRRIGLAVIVALGLTLAPLAVHAQPAGRQVKIAVLCAGACPFGGPHGRIEPLTTALERVGLVRGRTLAWDTFGVVNSEDQIVVEAQKLVSRRPDLILVWPGSVWAARAAKDATRTIPIVLMAVPDAVEHGLVDGLDHPGGNIHRHEQGIIVVHGNLDRAERKMLDRLREAAATLRLDAGISAADGTNYEQVLPPSTPRSRPGAQTAYPWREWGGGSTLITYGPRFSAVAERTAALIDRIVKGARPGNLPVEEPTTYELIIDGVMAKALGLTIPQSVLLRADQVIE